MIFKILLPRSVQTPNSDKNWRMSCPLQMFVTQLQYKYSLAWSDANLAFLAPDITTLTYFLTLSSTRVLDKILDRVLEQ